MFLILQKEEKSHINNLIYHLIKRIRKEQANLKSAEGIKIKEEINKMEIKNFPMIPKYLL